MGKFYRWAIIADLNDERFIYHFDGIIVCRFAARDNRKYQERFREAFGVGIRTLSSSPSVPDIDAFTADKKTVNEQVLTEAHAHDWAVNIGDCQQLNKRAKAVY